MPGASPAAARLHRGRPVLGMRVRMPGEVASIAFSLLLVVAAAGVEGLSGDEGHTAWQPSRRVFSDLMDQGGRRHYTEATGCVDPSAVFVPVTVEKCIANMGNNTAAEFCEDPYFGGLPDCCFSVQTGLCGPCLNTDCSKSALACTTEFINACGANQSLFNLSTSFQARHQTCVHGNATSSYWRHPDYIVRGDYRPWYFQKSGIDIKGCAEYCSSPAAAGCTAFIYNDVDLSCRLFTGDYKDVCDPVTDKTCVDNGQYYYALDLDNLYCQSVSEDCACTREFYYCMAKQGCANDEETISQYGDLCVASGCSTKQCNLPKSRSVGITSKCSDEFFVCAAAKGTTCGCTAEYRVCMDAIDGWQGVLGEVDPTSGLDIIGMCHAEGCTAAECGQEVGCNSTSIHCVDKWMACKGKSATRVQFTSFSVGYTLALPVPPQLSMGGAKVTFAPNVNDGIYGGATAYPGVYGGKYYFEFAVSGKCAIAGVGPKFDAGSFPGFDEDSFGYGDISLDDEGLLYNGAAVSIGPAFSKTQETIIGFAIDTETNSMWVSHDGAWLPATGLSPVGNPARGTNPTARLKPQLEYHPMAGYGCPNPQGFETYAIGRFTKDNFTYPMPAGFLAYQTDECTCARSFMECMGDGACDTKEVKVEVLTECERNGCLASECGIYETLERDECSGDVPVACNAEYLQCAANPPKPAPGTPVGQAREAERRHQCRCTRGMFECMSNSGCHLVEGDMREFAVLCAYNGCSAAECGMCTSTCNVTQLVCAEAYMRCEDAASRGDLSYLVKNESYGFSYYMGGNAEREGRYWGDWPPEYVDPVMDLPPPEDVPMARRLLFNGTVAPTP
eukprot:CAMPEP_0169432036 /NCGR_PEP_ID=MMETSP1042-20121227/3268_1 /TAXON_ID=464988 /ORGANISM="Hemiselmis andersenii, Strain CCMP1180" /LENGTH=842 /DNA_ID=CAMNT_0009542491 /DNA_START=202 /DNA_END=2726 /DNA_ORIENTATION=-